MGIFIKHPSWKDGDQQHQTEGTLKEQSTRKAFGTSVRASQSLPVQAARARTLGVSAGPRHSLRVMGLGASNLPSGKHLVPAPYLQQNDTTMPQRHTTPLPPGLQNPHLGKFLLLDPHLKIGIFNQSTMFDLFGKVGTIWPCWAHTATRCCCW